MTNKDLIKEMVGLFSEFNKTLRRIDTAIKVQSEILRELNDQNKLHKQAIDINTGATVEMTRSFNRIWYIFWLTVLALIVLAGAEKILKFL